MSELKRVENMVGRVNRWPTYMILHMFSTEPDAPATKKVAAFMYGNNVDLETASKCYVECRGREYRQFINDALFRRYNKWNRATKVRHQAEYYNMRTGRWQWINGKDLDQEEVVRPEVHVIDFGLDVVKREYPE